MVSPWGRGHPWPWCSLPPHPKTYVASCLLELSTRRSRAPCSTPRQKQKSQEAPRGPRPSSSWCLSLPLSPFIQRRWLCFQSIPESLLRTLPPTALLWAPGRASLPPAFRPVSSPPPYSMSALGNIRSCLPLLKTTASQACRPDSCQTGGASRVFPGEGELPV